MLGKSVFVVMTMCFVFALVIGTVHASSLDKFNFEPFKNYMLLWEQGEPFFVTVDANIRDADELFEEQNESDFLYISPLIYSLFGQNLITLPQKAPISESIPFVFIKTDKQTYKVGEPIHITLRNNGNFDAVLSSDVILTISRLNNDFTYRQYVPSFVEDINGEILKEYTVNENKIVLEPNFETIFTWEQKFTPFGSNDHNDIDLTPVDAGLYLISTEFLFYENNDAATRQHPSEYTVYKVISIVWR